MLERQHHLAAQGTQQAELFGIDLDALEAPATGRAAVGIAVRV